MNAKLVLPVLSLAIMCAACAKKPAPDQLPPAPVTEAGATDTFQPSQSLQQRFLAGVSSDRIYFDTDDSGIDGEDRDILQSQAQWLMQNPAVRVTIEGHCDERGTRDYNLALGEKRANAAKNALAGMGVDPSRITVISYGKERPTAFGSDPAAWAQNRRAVTVTVE